LVLVVVGLGGTLMPAAQATVARNSATYTRCAANPCTNAHTVAGTNPALAVCVTWWHYIASPTITAVTWNGIALAHVVTANNPACGDTCSSAIYLLPNPAAGTANVSVTFSAAFSAAVVGGVSFTGVDQTTPLGTPASAIGGGTPASVSLTSASGEMVLDCLGSIAAGAMPSMSSGQSSNWADFDPSGYTHNVSSVVAGTPTTLSVWSIAGAAQWVLVAVPIRSEGGGGGGTTPGTQRVISWNDNSDNEACFHLQWQTDQSLPNWVDLNACLPANTVSYANNIGTQTGDCYRVEATNAGGSNGFTDPVCAAAPPPPPPPQPPPPGATVALPLPLDFEEDLL